MRIHQDGAPAAAGGSGGRVSADAVKAVEGFLAILAEHEGCKWKQVGSCVYCEDHNLRLYQGSLPDEKRTTPKCEQHEWDDANSMSQGGWYYLCLRCGEREWTE